MKEEEEEEVEEEDVMVVCVPDGHGTAWQDMRVAAGRRGQWRRGGDEELTTKGGVGK